VPRIVRATVDALGDVGHYTFVSSMSVYTESARAAGAREGDEVKADLSSRLALPVGRLVRCRANEHRKTCVEDAVSGAPIEPLPRPSYARLFPKRLVRGLFQQRRRTGIEPA
jgi:hypothetical protein